MSSIHQGGAWGAFARLGRRLLVSRCRCGWRKSRA